MGISKSGKRYESGDIFDFAGTVAPPGAMALPIAQTNVSRAAYAKLFLSIQTTWGAGDGVNTFGLPWMKPDHAAVQANGNVGTQTAGEIMTHAHATDAAYPIAGGVSYSYASGGTGSFMPASVGASGGANNLAAGVRLLKCIQYL